jgi:hypothetical protein
MKRYIFLVAISLSSALCLSSSKKAIKIVDTSSKEAFVLKKKITAISKSIGKPFDASADLSLDELSENYIGWCKKLSKKEMIKILYQQEQLYAGFTEQDALNLIDRLKNKQPSAVYDFFIRYQKRFILPDLETQKRPLADRVTALHQAYKQEHDNRSFFRQIPFIHNLETHLLPDITTLTDQQLYEKIAEEMRKIGFSQELVQDEIDNLKTNSVKILQAKFSHLQDELAERLQYFNSTKKDALPGTVNADYYLGLMHTWVTTAASVMAGGVSLFGLSPFALQAVAGSSLLNSYITKKQNISKRQMLAMIYAQYKSYDALQDIYLDPHFKEAELLTKSEILSSIQENMEKVGCKQEFILQQMNKYKKLEKDELLIIEQEFKYFGQNYQALDMSEDDKKIAGYTKEDLLREIETYLPKFSIQEEEKEELLDELHKEDKEFARVVLLDLMKATTDQASLKETDLQMPRLSTTKEKFIIRSPKIVSDAIADRVIGSLQHDWQQEGKSKMYQYWRTKAVQNKLAQKEEGIADHLLDVHNRAAFARSITG